MLKIETATLEYPTDVAPSAADLDRVLSEDQTITNVVVIHCETTSGILNPIEQIGEVVGRHRKTYFVDSMSAFGAVPFDFEKCKIDYLVSSANKCIEGVPGFGFIIAAKAALEAAQAEATP